MYLLLPFPYNWGLSLWNPQDLQVLIRMDLCWLELMGLKCHVVINFLVLILLLSHTLPKISWKCVFFFCLVKWQTREINASRQAVILSTTPARSWLRILWMTMELDENEKKYVQPSFLWFSLKTEMNFWEFLLGFAWFLFYMWKSMNIIPGNSKISKCPF